MMEEKITNMHKNKIFRNLFYSYIVIIALCFFAYSGIVIYETSALTKEQVTQFYDLTLKEVANEIDLQLGKAMNITAGINSSYTVNQFSIKAIREQTVDSYLLYQTILEIQSKKAGSESFYIYDAILMLNQYNRVYSASSGTINLTETFNGYATDEISVGIGNLNSLFNMDINQLTFNKEFIIYTAPYRYNLGTTRGTICVLIQKAMLESLMNRIITGEAHLAVFWEEELILGEEAEEGISFTLNSTANIPITYKLVVDNSEFFLSYNSLWSVALLIGFVVCVLYLILAFVFSHRYYIPFRNIRQLIGNRGENLPNSNNRSDGEMNSIVIGVEELLVERDNYRDKIVTISPYAEQGLLHGIVSGSMDMEILNTHNLKQYINLEKLYFIVAVVDLAYMGRGSCNKDDLRIIKKLIMQKAKEFSDKDTKIVCYEQDSFHVCLIVNSDHGEKIEDLLYTYYDKLVLELINFEYTLTMGVDEVKEDVTRLFQSCINGTRALQGMLIGGRGFIYFYEEESMVSADYYFPKDPVKIISKALKENDLKTLHEFLQTIGNKNQKEFELSLTAIQLLLDELYISTVKAVKIINAVYTVTIHIEKLQWAATFEEVITYYNKVYEAVCEQIQEAVKNEMPIGEVEKMIIDYVDNNFTNDSISLAHITDKFKVNNKHVTYLFKKQTGITYLQYVHEKRIGYAVRLLKTTDYSLEKIAEKCGYCNILTFRRNFKAIMNENPGNYRDR